MKNMNSLKTVATLLGICSLLMTSCTVSNLDAVSRGYIKEGSAKYRNHDYKGSLRIGRLAAIYDPKNFCAFQLIGSSYYMMNKYDSAVKEYDSAITICPKDNFSRFFRGYALGILNRLDSAIADNDFNIRHNYMKACSYNNRAINEKKLKQFDAALKDLDSCMNTSYYNHRFVFINKYYVYIEQEKYDLALAELDKCINADPKQLSFAIHAKNLNGTQLLKLKDDLPKDSLFLNQMKCFTDAYTEKGYLYILMGKYKDALWNLNHERLIPIPSYIQMAYRSYIPKLTMQYDKAFENIDSAIRINPNDGFAYMCKGNIYSSMGKYDEAKQYYNLALTKDSLLGYAYEDRGYLYCREGKLDSALVDFKRAKSKNENIHQSYLHNAIGYAYFLNKQYNQALMEYDSAKNLGKPNYQPLYEYKQEAKDALENKGTNFCTLIHWQAPVNDVNELVDHAQFCVGINEPLAMNFKIVTNHPIEVNKLFLMLNGQSIPETYPNAVTLMKEDKSRGIFEYAYTPKLTLPKGSQTIGLNYYGKSSQRMVVIVQ